MRRKTVIARPLKAPPATPTRTPATIASGSGRPALKLKPMVTDTSAISEPTERSIPPVRMTKVMPSATSPASEKRRVASSSP